MNRLHHIKQTLPKNIENTQEYDSAEFVLLDYSSTDGLLEWVENNMITYLNSGRLKYYRIEGKKIFERSRSRNLAISLAQGKYVCSVDADNYIGKGFADYVVSTLEKNKNAYLVSDVHQRFYFLRNTFGRFCVRKEDFEAIGGLDESMKGYGAEIMDLYTRFEACGLQEKVIEDISFLNSISHDDDERVKHEFFLNQLDAFYIEFKDSDSSSILLLYKDSTFESLDLAYTNDLLPGKIIEKSYRSGHFEKLPNHMIFCDNYEANTKEYVRLSIYNLIENEEFINEAAKVLPFMINQYKQSMNSSQKRIKIQNPSFIEEITLNLTKNITI